MHQATDDAPEFAPMPSKLATYRPNVIIFGQNSMRLS